MVHEFEKLTPHDKYELPFSNSPHKLPDEYMNVGFDKFHGIVEHIMKASDEDVKTTLKEMEELRASKRNDLGTTKDLSMQHIARIPYPIWKFFTDKYGQTFFRNKKNLYNFLKVFHVFKACNKI